MSKSGQSEIKTRKVVKSLCLSNITEHSDMEMFGVCFLPVSLPVYALCRIFVVLMFTLELHQFS